MALRHLVVPLAEPSVGPCQPGPALSDPEGSISRFQVVRSTITARHWSSSRSSASAGTVLVAPGPVAPHEPNSFGRSRRPARDVNRGFELTLQIIAHSRELRTSRGQSPTPRAREPTPSCDGSECAEGVALPGLREHRRMLGSRGLGSSACSGCRIRALLVRTRPFAILGLALLPLMAWGSHSPIRSLECVALFALPILRSSWHAWSAVSFLQQARLLRFLAMSRWFSLPENPARLVSVRVALPRVAASLQDLE